MSPRTLKNILLLLAVVAITTPSFFCNTPEKETAAAGPKSDWLNVYDTTVQYVGIQTCRTCHEAIYNTFIQTGMGQSFGTATRQKSAADFAPAHAVVYDKDLDFYYKPYWEDDSLHIMEYRVEGKDTVHKRIQTINYIVGSGQHTNSHIFSVNGYLYQAPITFYTQKKRWDLAPGFEKGGNSRFSRLIESECMTCHNGYPAFVASSQNKYTALKTGIDCERCHGPGSLHVAEKQKGVMVDTSQKPDYTIVNPRRLPTELQNNICQRCHLQGIAVLNDGKNFFDFHPGMKLSEVMNVFMPQYEGAQDKMIMASHVERMKKSQCYVASGKLSCITCHNPHVSVKFTPRQQYLNACNSCHAGARQVHCAEKAPVRAKKNDDCVTCHMAHNGSIDIPHVAVTDHFIRKRPAADSSVSKIRAFLGLRCFNNDQVDAITTGRSYMEFFERYNQNRGLIDSALYYLNKETAKEGSEKQNRDYIRAYYLLKNYTEVIKYAAGLQPAAINDAWTAYRVGDAYMQQKQAEKALPWYRRATEIWKFSLDFQSKYAICLISLNNYEEAMKVCQFIIDENPDYTAANTNIGFLYMQQGNYTMAYGYLTRALVLDPDNEQVSINMAVWYHNSRQPQQAKQVLERLVKRRPDNERAKAMLADLMQQM